MNIWLWLEESTDRRLEERRLPLESVITFVPVALQVNRHLGAVIHLKLVEELLDLSRPSGIVPGGIDSVSRFNVSVLV